MKKIDVRKSTDERRIFRLVRKIFPKALPRFSENDFYFIAKAGGKDAGFAHLIKKNGKILLQGIGVVEGCRGKGIGGMLMDKVIDFANGEGMDILLKVKPSNCPALNLYEKKGFTIKKVRDTYILERKRFT
ncbi:MAG: GNAT family N-acetyltransferase [Candidatus Bilamarchaeaceae archaeon]